MLHLPSPPSLPIRTRPRRAGIGRDRKKRHGQMAPSVGWRYHISALLHHAFWLQDQGSWALSVEPSQVCRQSVEHRESSLTIDAGQMHIILPKARAGSMPRTCRAGRCQFSRCFRAAPRATTHTLASTHGTTRFSHSATYAPLEFFCCVVQRRRGHTQSAVDLLSPVPVPVPVVPSPWLVWCEGEPRGRRP